MSFLIEEEVAVLLRNNATLMSYLTGGVYTDEQVGIEGIRRGDDNPESGILTPTRNAFDERGVLKPCALVVPRAKLDLEETVDMLEQTAGVVQVVQVFFYQFRGHAEIVKAKNRSYKILQNAQLSKGFRLRFAFETSPTPDTGPVRNSTTIRQDWRWTGVRRPTDDD